MCSRSHLILTLTGVMILSGCGGFFGVSPSQTAHPTVTSAPVPTDMPESDHTASLVPGLSEDGISNAYELGRAHREVLSNRSYTERLNETTRYANGSLRFRSISVVRATPTDGGHRSIGETVYDGPVTPPDTPFPAAERLQLYSDGQVHVRVTFLNRTTSVESFDRTNRVSHTMELVFSAFETRIDGTMACGNRSCYRVRSTVLDSPGYLDDALLAGQFEGRTYWRNSSLVALIDDRGFVHEYRVRFTVETSRYTYTVVRRVSYSSIGETVVERPDWVPDQPT